MDGCSFDNEFTTIYDWSRYIEDSNFFAGLSMDKQGTLGIRLAFVRKNAGKFKC